MELFWQLCMRVAVLVLLVFSSLRSWPAEPGVLVADRVSPIVQNDRADRDHLSRMRDLGMLRRFVRSHYLVSVPASTRFFYLHAVPAAYRYCRPWTKLFIERLSSQFYARFHERLRVTSLVRTVASQAQ